MSRSDSNTPELTNDQLIRRLLDGVIDPDEFATLEARLQEDEALRVRYVHLVDLEASLYEECSIPQREGLSLPAKQHPPRWRRLGPIAALMTITTLALLAAVSILRWQVPADPGADGALAGPDVPATTHPSSDISFEPARIEETPPVAVLTRLEGVASDSLSIGHRFRPGTITLPQGRIQLEFFNGARVALVAPATLRLISSEAATLISGQASAYVPEPARGFVLNTPEAAVVDLGTEFGVIVDEEGATEIAVLQGEVEVSRLGNDGNTVHSKKLYDFEVARVDATGMSATTEPRRPPGFPEVADVDRSPLPVTPAYVDAVEASAPIIFWRFEGVEAGRIPNEMSDRWWAEIVAEGTHPSGLSIENGQAVFEPASAPRILRAMEPVPGWNDGEYSIEFWMRPDQFTYMTCVSVVNEGDAGHDHLNVIEVANHTTLVHEPGSVRFLHRFPPNNDLTTGTNLFAGATCTPGQWQHVVAVKGTDRLQLYSNGQLKREVELQLTHEDASYDVYLGQLRTFGTLRQFVGTIDEFAMYNRALTPQEIAHHYSLIADEDTSP